MDVLPRSSSSSSERTRAKSAATPESVDRRNYAFGVGLLLLVVFLWTASNFVTQDLFDTGYDKPFLVTYLNTCSFSVYLLSYGARRLWRARRSKSVGASGSAGAGLDRHGYTPLAPNDAEEGSHLPHHTHSRSRSRSRSHSHPHGVHEVPLPPLTTRETAVLAMLFTGPWFLANWALDAGLLYTSVASATILSGMSGFFTLCVGRLVGIDSFTLAKVGAVATSFAGVVLVSLSDADATPSTSPSPAPSTSILPSPLSALVGGGSSAPARNYALGDALALLSALLYALYTVLLKVRVRTEARVDMQLFFGFVGAFNALALWPVGVLLHLTGVEPFEPPSSSRAVVGLLVNMFITLSSDFIYALAMLKTSPLVVTVGLSLTMPLAVIGDAALGHAVKARVVLGAALVLAAFGVVGVEDSQRPRDDVVLVEDEGGDSDGGGEEEDGDGTEDGARDGRGDDVDAELPGTDRR